MEQTTEAEATPWPSCARPTTLPFVSYETLGTVNGVLYVKPTTQSFTANAHARCLRRCLHPRLFFTQPLNY